MKKPYLLAPAILLALLAQQPANAQFAFQASESRTSPDVEDYAQGPSWVPASPITEPFVIRGAFRGFVRQRQHHLSWTTQAQSQVNLAELQYSKDGLDFSVIDRLDASSLDATARTYSFVNPNPVNGLNHYRLRLVNHDGQETMTQVISLEATVRPLHIVHPGSNPFYDMVRLEVESQQQGHASFRLRDAQGRTVLRGQQELEAGKNEIQLQGLDRLRPGKYMFDLRLGELVVTQSLQKAK